MATVIKEKAPMHPGEVLAKEFLQPKGVTQRDLANGIRVPYQRVNEIVNGRRGITASTALRLAKFLGETEEFWLYLQLRWDLHHTKKSEETVLARIQSVSK
jgi:addiction module HigA family antidote